MTNVGIDVSKLSFDVAALADGGEVEQRTFSNDEAGFAQLTIWLARFVEYRCVVEATGSYHRRLVRALAGCTEFGTVLNPAQVSYFARSLARRNKTDKVDALMLAMYSRERRPAPSPEANNSLQSLARELHALQEDIGRLKNRLEAAEHGLTHPEVPASLKRRIKALEAERDELQQEMEREAQQHKGDDVRLLSSIPGVATKSACLILAEIGDVRRFSTAAKLVAFAGLTPMQATSGTSVNKHSRISKLGSSDLRRVLFMPSLVGIRHNPTLRAFYERLVTNGKSKKSALIACAAKLLRIIYGVLIHRQPFKASHFTA